MAHNRKAATGGNEKRLDHLLDLTAQIISSHAGKSAVLSKDLPGLIEQVFGSLKSLNLDELASASSAILKPASDPSAIEDDSAKVKAEPAAAGPGSSGEPARSATAGQPTPPVRRGRKPVAAAVRHGVPAASPAPKRSRRAKSGEAAPAISAKPRRGSRIAKASVAETTAPAATPVAPEASLAPAAPIAAAAPKPARRRAVKSASAGAVAASATPAKRARRTAKMAATPPTSPDRPRRKPRTVTPTGTDETGAAKAARAVPPTAVVSKPRRARTAKTDQATNASTGAPPEKPVRKMRKAPKTTDVPSAAKGGGGKALAFATAAPTAEISSALAPAVRPPKRSRRRLSIVTKA